MNEYTDLAATMMDIDTTDEATVEERVETALLDRYDIDLTKFVDLVDDLLPFTMPFPSALVEGKRIQAFVEEDPSSPGVYNAFVRKTIPPPSN